MEWHKSYNWWIAGLTGLMLTVLGDGHADQAIVQGLEWFVKASQTNIWVYRITSLLDYAVRLWYVWLIALFLYSMIKNHQKKLEHKENE